MEPNTCYRSRILKKYKVLQRDLKDFKREYPLTYRLFSSPLREWYLGHFGIYKSIKSNMLYTARTINRKINTLSNIANLHFYAISSKYRKFILISPTLFRFPILISRLKEICNDYNIGLVVYLSTPIELAGMLRFMKQYKIRFDSFIIFGNSRYFDYDLMKTFFEKLERGDENFDDIECKLKGMVTNLIKYFSTVPSIAVVSAGDNLYTDGLVLEATKRLNVPSLVFAHGYPGEPYDGFLPVFADYLLVWDDVMREKLRKLNDSENDIITFGYPRFDKRYIIEKKLDLKQWEHTEKRILFASQPFEEVGDREFITSKIRSKINNLLLYLNKKLNYDITIRPHPAEARSIYAKTPTQLHRFISKTSYDLTSLLQDIIGANIVISFNSSVLYESALLNIISISIKFSNRRYFYDDYPEIYKLESWKIDPSIVENFLSQKKQYQGLSRYLVPDFKENLLNLFERIGIWG